MLECPKNCNILCFNEDKFCYQCGTKLVKNYKCSCGRELADSNKFCPGCGKEVKRG